MLNIEMRNLILEALSIKDANETPQKQAFFQYDYCGTVSSLRAIVEFIAISKGLIKNKIEIPRSAWGVTGENVYIDDNTNFSIEELNMFNEEVHYLIYQNVISPGAYGNYGDELPYFHVTQYGMKCLESKEILPYDSENFIKRVKTYPQVDDWEIFYISQSIQCYNFGALDSSIIMLGLAGEYLAERLIAAMLDFLHTNEASLHTQLLTALRGKRQISQKYIEYEKKLRKLEDSTDTAGVVKYPALNRLNPSIDIPAKAVYATYLRLTRNSITHPANIKMDKLECLTLLSTFLKYSETQHKYLDYLMSNS